MIKDFFFLLCINFFQQNSVSLSFNHSRQTCSHLHWWGDSSNCYYLLFLYYWQIFMGHPKHVIMCKYMVYLNLVGDYWVGLIDSCHVIIRLSSKVGYIGLFYLSFLYIIGFFMHILKWSLCFDSSMELLITLVCIVFL